MKWKNVKQRIENAGVTDDDEMDFIDISDDTWHATKNRDGSFSAVHHEPPDDGLGDPDEAIS